MRVSAAVWSRTYTVSSFSHSDIDIAVLVQGAHSAEAESGHQHSQEELDEPTKVCTSTSGTSSTLGGLWEG